MHVLIFDPLHGGHHLNWVKLLGNAASPLAERVTFVTAEQVPGSPEFAEHLSQMPANFHVDASLPRTEVNGARFEAMRLSRRAWAGLRDAIVRHQPDHVYLPHADMLTMIGGTSFPGNLRLPIAPEKIDAIFIGSSFAYTPLPFRQRIKNKLELRGVEKLPADRLLFIDAVTHTWLVKNRPDIARRSVLLPDPVTPVGVYDKTTARSKLGIEQEGRWLSCVGILDARKGADDLVRTFAEAELKPTDRLLLAGRAKPEVLAAVDAARAKIGNDRIVLIDRLLSNQEIDWSLSAADVVAVAYHFPSHLGSASILIRAVAAGRPVLASERAWPGYVTQQNQLGWIYPQDAAGRPAAITQALTGAADFRFTEAGEAFAKFHSVERFCQIMTEPLRRSAHRPISAGRVKLNPRIPQVS